MSGRVVCFHYFYPPLGGIAARRAVGLTRHLEACGWQPVVITPAGGHYYREPGDSAGGGSPEPRGRSVAEQGGGGADGVPATGADSARASAGAQAARDERTTAVTVVRTGSVELSRLARAFGRRLPGVEAADDEHEPLRVGARAERLRRWVREALYVPDAQVGWLPFAYRAGVRAVLKGGASTLYSSAFPITAHLAALFVSRRTGVPWIAEFRDLWTRHHISPRPPGLRRRIDERIERTIVRSAARVVTVTETWCRELMEQYPDASPGRFRVLPNGYEPAEFEAASGAADPERFRIVYVGTMYGEAQDPEPLFRALAAVAARGAVERSRLRLEMVGRADARARELAAAAGVGDLVEFTGFVGHDEAVSRQKSADLLVVLLDPANPRLRGCIPGKVFEYLAAERPVLAIVPPDGETAALLRSAGNARITGGSVAEVEAVLRDALDAWRSGRTAQRPVADVLGRYRYDRLARELASLLDEVETSKSERWRGFPAPRGRFAGRPQG
ncbi:MAG: glycosyltransferase [Gemmatimonadetes bacterium]|nr:glycosyltransferase [Gemmatimonadota bacterium]